MTVLFPYQVEGARFLAERKRALLADDMGLGKSAQAIAACDIADAVARTECPLAWGPSRLQVVVVICPASVRENWRREFDRFANPEVKRVVKVLSYDKAAKGEHLFNPFSGDPETVQIDCLILDEAHYLKTRTAKRTKAIFGLKCDGVGGLVERAKHVFLLTGTPTPNNPSELWPALRAVMPQAISTPRASRIKENAWEKPLTYWQFINRYCHLRDNGFGYEIVKGKNLSELRERIKPYVLRRKKDDVLKDLPPIRFDQLYLDGGALDLPPEVLQSVPDVLRVLEEDGIKGLAKLAPHVATLRRLTGLAKVNPAVEWIKDWLEAGGRKLVVFAHHRDVIDGVFAGLISGKDRTSTPMVVHGGTTPAERQHSIDTFQNEKDFPVFIGQIQAAGVGITLTAASDVLFVESSWVPTENDQAAMRVHRIGQRNACLVRFATLAGSIDEKIQRAVVRKAADIAKLFN